MSPCEVLIEGPLAQSRDLSKYRDFTSSLSYTYSWHFRAESGDLGERTVDCTHTNNCLVIYAKKPVRMLMEINLTDTLISLGSEGVFLRSLLQFSLLSRTYFSPGLHIGNLFCLWPRHEHMFNAWLIHRSMRDPSTSPVLSSARPSTRLIPCFIHVR